MQFTFKPLIDTIQLTNATLEKIARANLEILNSISKATFESTKAYFDACNTYCKMQEENVATTAKKA